MIPQRLIEGIFPGSEPSEELGPAYSAAYQDMLRKYYTYEYYYSGKVFDELANPKDTESKELKYPIGINLAREFADIIAGYVWGQYATSVVNVEIERRPQESGEVAAEEEKRCMDMERVLRQVWEDNENDAAADQAAVDQAVYGGVVVKTTYDNRTDRIRDEWLAPDLYMPRWNPMDRNELLEVYIMFMVQRQDAIDIFGIDPARASHFDDEVLYWERWSKTEYEISIGDVPVRDTTVNPMGFIPHIYIPRYRSSADNFGYFGVSAIGDIIYLQDEINARLADIGDGINYASHPIRVLVNYGGNADTLPVGPDATWSLGSSWTGKDPEAYVLDQENGYPEAMKFVERLIQLAREETHLPPIAFGEDEGSQRSGTTLMIRFLPLTQQIQRTRLNWASGLRQRARRVLQIATQYEQKYKPRFSAGDLEGRMLDVRFAPILPKDISDIVNEWSLRITNGFGTGEEAYRALGHPKPKEAEKDALAYMEAVAKAEAKARPMTPGGVPGGKPNSTPGSAGNAGKGGQDRRPAQRNSK